MGPDLLSSSHLTHGFCTSKNKKKVSLYFDSLSYGVDPSVLFKQADLVTSTMYKML